MQGSQNVSIRVLLRDYQLAGKDAQSFFTKAKAKFLGFTASERALQCASRYKKALNKQTHEAIYRTN